MKVAGIPGGNLREKRGFPEGLIQTKSRKFQGGHNKIDWNCGGATIKNGILNRGYNFFLEKPNFNFVFLETVEKFRSGSLWKSSPTLSPG